MRKKYGIINHILLLLVYDIFIKWRAVWHTSGHILLLLSTNQSLRFVGVYPSLFMCQVQFNNTSRNIVSTVLFNMMGDARVNQNSSDDYSIK